MHIKNLLITLIMSSLLLFSCKPEEGKGGLASIQGVVMVQNLNTISENSGEPYPAKDEDVFISYGNSGLADDKAATSSNGSYKFDYLTKGEYTVFVYSEDSTICGKTALQTYSQNISLDSKKDEATIDTFKIYKHLDYDDGGGAVKGMAYEILFLSSVAKDTLFAQDADVYLQFQNDPTIVERVRVGYDGSFQINKLIPGKYTLFMFSQVRLYDSSNKEYITRDFEITDNSSIITVDDIYTKNYKNLN